MPMTDGMDGMGVGVMQSQDVDVVARSYPWLGGAIGGLPLHICMVRGYALAACRE
jgi:hypothetical protein